MQLREPRVRPLPKSEWNDEVRELLESVRRQGRVYNIFATLAHHPKLLKRWLVFGNHLLFKSTLPARERELIILRTAWLRRSEYEWGQHVRIGKQVGLNDEELDRLKEGANTPGWNRLESALLRAVDELCEYTTISDPTWQELAVHYNTQQVLDLIFTVGQYSMLAMALNSLGVQLDEGITGFD